MALAIVVLPVIELGAGVGDRVVVDQDDVALLQPEPHVDVGLGGDLVDQLQEFGLLLGEVGALVETTCRAADVAGVVA